MKINLKKASGCLIPSLPQDEEKLARWHYGEVLEVTIKKPRNSAFHRKFFALINVVFDNQDKYDNQAELLTEIKLKCGHYHEHITTKGEIVYVPKSISFANMGELEFEEFYSKAIDVVLKYFMPIEKEFIDKMVEEVLNFS